MAETLQVRVRREGEVGILETEGYLNDLTGEKVAEAGDPNKIGPPKSKNPCI